MAIDSEALARHMYYLGKKIKIVRSDLLPRLDKPKAWSVIDGELCVYGRRLRIETVTSDSEIQILVS